MEDETYEINRSELQPKEDSPNSATAPTIREIQDFQRKLQNDPDSVSDEEIRSEYGDDTDPQDIRDLFRNSTFRRISKNPRASARAKLRRRIKWLEWAISEVESAIEGVLNSPGKIYKKGELDNLRDALNDLREKTGLIGTREDVASELNFEDLAEVFDLASPNQTEARDSKKDQNSDDEET